MAKAKKKPESKPEATNEAPETNDNPETPDDDAPINPGGNPRDEMRAALAKKNREHRDAPPAPDVPPPWESEEASEAEAERVRAELEARAASQPGDAPPDDPGAPDPGEGADPAPENAPEIVPGSQREINGVLHVMMPGGEEVPYEQVIQGYTTAAQKEAAATQTWQEAAKLRREAEEYYSLAQRKQSQPDPEERKAQIEKLNKLRREYDEANTFGEEEVAAQKLTEYHETLAALQAPQGPAPVDEAAVKRTLRKIDEERREQEMGEAFIWYRDQVTDISQVPENDAIFGVKLEQAHQANPGAAPRDLFQKAVAATREHLNGGKPAKDDWATREARKAGAASTGGGAGSPRRAVEPDRTPGGARETLTESDMHDPRYNRLQAIMKSRGQSVMTGQAPIAGPGGNRVS